MILGFTGTREGMTNIQRNVVADWLRDKQPDEIHHGDCVGADSEFHDAALLNINQPLEVIVHPANGLALRAFRRSGITKRHEPKPPLERNKDIVDACDELLAAPKTLESELRSGTWSTIRYAQKAKKTVTIIGPDGSINAQGYTSLAEIFAGR